jgi:hypothetical protein
MSCMLCGPPRADYASPRIFWPWNFMAKTIFPWVCFWKTTACHPTIGVHPPLAKRQSIATFAVFRARLGSVHCLTATSHFILTTASSIFNNLSSKPKTGRLLVGMERLRSSIPNPNPNEPDALFMWSWCKLCSQVTPIVPVQPETWSLSLAKYLELTFDGVSFLPRAQLCSHDVHRHHVRYFGKVRLRCCHPQSFFFTPFERLN